jgi:hypothetical protein
VILADLNLRVKYYNKSEVFRANDKELEIICNSMEEHCEKRLIEYKKNNTELELEKYKIDKEYEYKYNLFTKMFKEKEITFEQMKALLGIDNNKKEEKIEEYVKKEEEYVEEVEEVVEEEVEEEEKEEEKEVDEEVEEENDEEEENKEDSEYKIDMKKIKKYEGITGPQIKIILNKYKLNDKGAKKTLYERLKEFLEKKMKELGEELEEDDERERELNNMGFFELRKMGVNMEIPNICLETKKSKLIKRILDYNKNESEEKKEEKEEKEENEEENNEIYQYTNRGQLVRSYNSIEEAERKSKVLREEIMKCIKGEQTKGGGFIWKDKEENISKDELKVINYKKSMGIIKEDEKGKEVERYESIKEVCEKNEGLSKGIIDRLCETGEIREGYKYRYINKGNKVKHLTKSEKEEILKRYNKGEDVNVIARIYGKTEKYLKILIKGMKVNKL